MQSKTQQFVRLCHYVIYNYMFRPCEWAIIRLFVEPVGLGAGGQQLSYILSCGVCVGC